MPESGSDIAFESDYRAGLKELTKQPESGRDNALGYSLKDLSLFP